MILNIFCRRQMSCQLTEEAAMLDFAGTVAAAGLMVLIINTLTLFLDITRIAKLVLSAILGLWIGTCAAAASAGIVATSRPFPLIGIFVALPLAAAALATAWPAARKAMLSLPMQVMIGLNVGRVLAVFFLLLAAEGRLAGPFPYFAAGGDIITAIVALPMMWLAARPSGPPTSAIAAWNLFGIADLVLAITLGVTSAEGSPLQVFHTAPGSEAMQYLPWSFVPTVLVPLWLILHAIIWVQLRRLRRAA
jgi:hypothetical protein